MGFPVLSTRLPDSKKFRRDLSEERKSVFRSTIFPMDTALLKGSGIRGVFRRDKRHHQTAVSMGSRKVNTEGIDEELLLASIGRRTQDGTLRPAQEVPAAAPTEEDNRRTGTISCATRNTGKSAEGKWTPEKAGRGLQRAIPAPQRDKDPPMCLYQP